ncbi:hypothetical protein GJ496_011572 [Pomphorhynchus laevis]|nr:hypothetical protein GJ496_011572 [Pomphorhynchus laevis]
MGNKSNCLRKWPKKGKINTKSLEIKQNLQINFYLAIRGDLLDGIDIVVQTSNLYSHRAFITSQFQSFSDGFDEENEFIAVLAFRRL